MANIPSGNPMFMANSGASMYPSMPSNLGEWGNNLRRFTCILHSETTGANFGGADYAWTNHSVPNAGSVRFPLKLTEYINAPRAKLIPESLTLNMGTLDPDVVRPNELEYALVPNVAAPYTRPQPINTGTAMCVRCPQAVQRNTFENCDPQKPKKPPLPAAVDSGTAGYLPLEEIGGPTNIIAMFNLNSKQEDSLEQVGATGTPENRGAWKWGWEQQFNKNDNGAEIDSSFWNNGHIELHLTDDIGRPFKMFNQGGSGATIQTANIQYTFKFSIVYEPEEE